MARRSTSTEGCWRSIRRTPRACSSPALLLASTAAVRAGARARRSPARRRCARDRRCSRCRRPRSPASADEPGAQRGGEGAGRTSAARRRRRRRGAAGVCAGSRHRGARRRPSKRSIARGLASSDLRQRLAAIHVAHERLAEAKAVLERAATPTPTVSVLIDLARVTRKLGDRKGALGYLAHAAIARAVECRGAFPVRHGLRRAGPRRRGLRIAQAGGGARPRTTRSSTTRWARSPMHRHDPSEALPYFETYVRLAPNDPRGRFALGAARYYSKQLDAARADLEIAARSAETATGAHFFLGRIARQLNDLDTARREIDLALRGSADHRRRVGRARADSDPQRPVRRGRGLIAQGARRSTPTTTTRR